MGRSAISCLPTDTHKVKKPFPKAWNTEPATMQKPAKIKLKLIYLKALTPILSISSEALNRANSLSGMN